MFWDPLHRPQYFSNTPRYELTRAERVGRLEPACELCTLIERFLIAAVAA